MATRADLLKAAEVIAAQTRAAAERAESSASAATFSGELAKAAKATLEAAALAENVTAGQIDTALGEIQDLLEEGGVLEKSIELPPAEFLRQTFGALLAWRKEAFAAKGYEVAYDQLRELLEGLERDFVAGDTETSRRIAGRIRARLDDATVIVNEATGGRDGQAQE